MSFAAVVIGALRVKLMKNTEVRSQYNTISEKRLGTFIRVGVFIRINTVVSNIKKNQIFREKNTLHLKCLLYMRIWKTNLILL